MLRARRTRSINYVATFNWSLDPDTPVTLCNEIPFRIPDDDGVVADDVCACG